jgi:hypothetical protein
MRTLTVEILSNGKGGAAAARDKKHAGMLLLFLKLPGSPLFH